MRLLDFAADLTLIPEYIKINIIKNQAVSYPFSEFVALWEGLAPSPYGDCVAILCGGFAATFLPRP